MSKGLVPWWKVFLEYILLPGAFDFSELHLSLSLTLLILKSRQKTDQEPGVIVHVCTPRAPEAEARDGHESKASLDYRVTQ